MHKAEPIAALYHVGCRVTIGGGYIFKIPRPRVSGLIENHLFDPALTFRAYDAAVKQINQILRDIRI